MGTRPLFVPGRLSSRCVLAAACAALACAACAAEIEPEVAAATQAIVGGEPARANAWLNVGWLESGCSATLVHERVLVFAGHCGIDHARVFFGQAFEVALDIDAGTASLPMPERYESVALTRCERHPDAAIGSGFDVAFCELTEPIVGRPVVPLVAGCERAQLEAGAAVTIVGFGFDTLEPEGRAGIKRVAEARIVGVSRELYIGDDDAGTCPGDSGGPAFIRVDADAERPDWRLAAVLSSGAAGRCGVGRYTDVTQVRAWLEAASGYDLTPCASEPAACSVANVGARPAAMPGVFALLVYLFVQRRGRRSRHSAWLRMRR